MFIYFKSVDSVLTCEYIPQLLPVEYIKQNNLEYMCNRWVKNNMNNGVFTLSYKNYSNHCEYNCDNSEYMNLHDFDSYKCYNCGIKKEFDEHHEILYLQNSGSLDIICVDKYNQFCELCEVTNYPNVFKWNINNDDVIHAIHITETGNLSDKNVFNNIDAISKYSQITFIEHI